MNRRVRIADPFRPQLSAAEIRRRLEKQRQLVPLERRPGVSGPLVINTAAVDYRSDGAYRVEPDGTRVKLGTGRLADDPVGDAEGEFRQAVIAGNWPDVMSCYFALCAAHRRAGAADQPKLSDKIQLVAYQEASRRGQEADARRDH